MNIDEIAREQFRLDTNCSVSCEDKYHIMINESRVLKGSRYFDKISPFFRAIIYMGDMYMMCDKEILPWARETYSTFYPEWFCRFDNLRILDKKLHEYGYGILDTHVYFLPDSEYDDYECYEFECPYELQWLDADAIERFHSENTFHNALLYCPGCKDEFAVAALDRNGCKIAMAGISSDGINLWQIGIDVNEEYRQKGLAVYLTSLIKDRAIEMGRLPFYGTSESHALSRNVAIRAGFRPAWCEIYSTALDKNQINV